MLLAYNYSRVFDRPDTATLQLVILNMALELACLHRLDLNPTVFIHRLLLYGISCAGLDVAAEALMRLDLFLHLSELITINDALDLHYEKILLGI